jgi:hypothetical protein
MPAMEDQVARSASLDSSHDDLGLEPAYYGHHPDNRGCYVVCMNRPEPMPRQARRPRPKTQVQLLVTPIVFIFGLLTTSGESVPGLPVEAGVRKGVHNLRHTFG